MSAAYYVCTLKVDFPATEVPAYYVCTTQVDKKNAKTLRFSRRDHAKTRRGVTFACQETQKHDGFGTAPTPKPAEGLRLYVTKCKNTTVLALRQRRNPQSGFSAATRRLPAEGCPRTQRNVKKRRFWHRDHAETRRGLSADTKKRKKNDGFGTATTPKPAEGCPRKSRNVKKTTVLAPRPRRNPQRVAIPIGDVNPARRLRKSNFNLEI